MNYTLQHMTAKQSLPSPPDSVGANKTPANLDALVRFLVEKALKLFSSFISTYKAMSNCEEKLLLFLPTLGMKNIIPHQE